MKIAVYTIAKNEAQFVERWAKSAEDADYRLILDTGSTDNTIELAKEMGVDVQSTEITPWRFDYARNYALSLLPENVDICIALDMDEVLVPGWRQHLEKISLSTTRPRYKYIWSWNDDGSEGLVYAGDKIHRRYGYVWKHPVHEVIKPTHGEDVTEWIMDLVIEHHPDHTKSRAQYLPLLELAVSEDPNDDRNRFYLGREYFFNNRHSEAEVQFRAHLSLSQWAPERAASCRYLAKVTPDREAWLLRGVSEDRFRRESWVDLAMCYYDQRDWLSCLWAAKKAVEITDKPLDYLCEAYAWGYLPYDLAAISAYNLGMHEDAREFGRRAVELAPDDQRLVSNLGFYESA